jgi:hypothetical protein
MDTGEPWLTVVRGRPTDEELAALLAVVAGVAVRAATAGPQPAPATTATLRRTGRALVARESRWTPGRQWSHPRRPVPTPARTTVPAAREASFADAAGA